MRHYIRVYLIRNKCSLFLFLFLITVTGVVLSGKVPYVKCIHVELHSMYKNLIYTFTPGYTISVTSTHRMTNVYNIWSYKKIMIRLYLPWYTNIANKYVLRYYAFLFGIVLRCVN